MTEKEFIEYVWSFYGPRGIYGEFFGHSMQRGELEAACIARTKHQAYAGDTFDREAVRDALLDARQKLVAKRRGGK